VTVATTTAIASTTWCRPINPRMAILPHRKPGCGAHRKNNRPAVVARDRRELRRWLSKPYDPNAPTGYWTLV
jgi:hypothetical protein